MPRVDCISLAGIELVFYSGDHLPPHFHAIRRGEFNYRVFFLESRLTMLQAKHEKRPMAGPSRRALFRLIEDNRAALLEEFERKVNTDG